MLCIDGCSQSPLPHVGVICLNSVSCQTKKRLWPPEPSCAHGDSGKEQVAGATSGLAEMRWCFLKSGLCGSASVSA